MKYILAFIVLYAFTGFLMNVQGQSLVFKEGEIVRNEVTEKGWIAIRSLKKQTVFFKSSERGAVEELNLAEISNFRFDDYKEQFQVFKIPNGEYQFYVKQVDGSVSLFANKDGYVLEKNTGEYLYLQKASESTDGLTGNIKNAGMVSLFLAECNESLSLKNMNKTVRRYNICMGTLQTNKLKTRKVSLGVAAGLSTSFTSMSSSTSYLNAAKFEVPVGVQMGVSLEYAPPAYLERVGVGMEVLYSRISLNGHSSYYIPGATHEADIQMEIETLRFPFYFSYSFKPAFQGFYLQLGCSPYYFIDHKSSAQRYTVLDAGPVINESEESDILGRARNFSYGLFAGLGWNTQLSNHRLSLQLRAEKDYDMTGSGSTVQSTANFYFSVKYGVLTF